MREPLAAAALALLLATAGCALPSVGGAPSATPPESTPSPDASPTLPAAERPPGVAPNGTLVDEAALLDAHVGRVVASGGVWTVATNATVYQGGALRRVVRRQRTFVEPGGREYGYVLRNPVSRFEVWGNESVRVLRATSGNRTRYRVGEPIPDPTLAARPVLVDQIHGGTLRVTGVNRSGDVALLTLETTTPPPVDSGAFPRNATDVRDYHATLVVDPTGRIHRFEATATYTLRGETGTSVFRYELERTIPPSIDQPAWAREALRRSG